MLRRESTGTSTSDWDDDSMLTTTVTSSSRPLVTSLSTDNLQQELARATCTSDGLSDKENIVQQMKHHVKYLPDTLTTVCTLCPEKRDQNVFVISPIKLGQL